MTEKYKCTMCGDYLNNEPYQLCGDCKNESNKEIHTVEQEYGQPKEAH